MSVHTRLSAAKLWLISAPPVAVKGADAPRDLPYLAQALYALTVVESSEVLRMTCDERWRIYVNPVWAGAASIPEIGRELAHQIWHLLADHAARARDQGVDRTTAAVWNRCADATVSHTLDPDALRPAGLPDARAIGVPPALSVEEGFAILARLPVSAEPAPGGLGATEGCGSAADGVVRAHELAPDVDLGAVLAFDAAEVRRRVAIEYSEHVSARGTRPGDALRWARETLQPTVAWEPLLTSAVRRGIGWASGRGDFTYLRPSRRSGSVTGILLPGQHRRLPRISMLIDTSGSVDDRLLERALGEVDAAVVALGVPDLRVTVYSVDAAVHTVAHVRRSRDLTLVGAGGTDLRIGLAAVDRERPRPDVVIVFTDGGTPWPEAPPAGTVVVIALLGRRGHVLPQTPPWAVRVECLV